ncbi:hypothetical protein NDNC_0790 [Candidatus Nasuia deltocephalinicola]|nr:ribosome recycling factor [Candidatus Nasuia deltocephalinicola]BEH03913.1 hypothetical protein NDNC_0790 [Candidatus Nasuia deltocephalinicola]
MINTIKIEEEIKNCIKLFNEKIKNINTNNINEEIIKNLIINKKYKLKNISYIEKDNENNLIIQPIIEENLKIIESEIKKNINNSFITSKKKIKILNKKFIDLEEKNKIIKKIKEEKEKCKIIIRKIRKMNKKNIYEKELDKIINKNIEELEEIYNKKIKNII